MLEKDLKLLLEAGSQGLDLSPGDELSKKAYNYIIELGFKIEHQQSMLDEAYKIIMVRLDKLMDAKADTSEIEELKILADFVDNYEIKIVYKESPKYIKLLLSLESATEGSRELDSQIDSFFYSNGFHDDYECPFYTTSIDAKLPWENIYEVYTTDIIEGEPFGMIWEAWHENPKTKERFLGTSYTEPIARRIAAIKAL